jgi:selenocysteine-specific elongation factor
VVPRISLARAADSGPSAATAARAKEILGTTRKYALPLLEELDRRGRTRRRGDVREVVG